MKILFVLVDVDVRRPTYGGIELEKDMWRWRRIGCQVPEVLPTMDSLLSSESHKRFRRQS